MTYEEKKELYNFHKENCDRIEKERLEQQHNFDSWLLKLCAGSFAVSFAFIEKLVDLTKTPVFIKTFKFGKYKGKDVEEVAKIDSGYLNWMRTSMTDLDEDMKYTLDKVLKS